jgi:N-acetylmuramoyl-L-alanine amidase
VHEGECILSLSKRYGVPPERIWEEPANQSIRDQDVEETTLNPGDVVTIPDRETKEVAGATEERHRFRCTLGSAWLRVCFRRHGEPRANEPYVLHWEGGELAGSLDEQGRLRARLPRDATEAWVMLGEGSHQERFHLRVGHLDPCSQTKGIQQRLNNLGFYCGDPDGEVGEATRAALRRFQEAHDLAVTGALDDATQARIREIHGL